MIFEWDDFGSNHEISSVCQSHDCRDQLLRLKEVNPAFKATLFAIPGEMTPELYGWYEENCGWIELAVHGFFHTSNWECEKMSYEEFDKLMGDISGDIDNYYEEIFRAPGWQISTEAMRWLADNDWIIADQGYNDTRRPKELKAYVNYNGQFTVIPKDDYEKLREVEAYHGHVWNVGVHGGEPNGIYEDYDKVERLVREADSFQFVSELF